MKIEGRCHCGAIRYEARIDPERVIICHCTDCQTISGAPYRANVPVATENFRLTGEPKLYVKTADSGRKITTAFCGECGAAIYSARPERGYLNLRLGAVKERAELAPKLQGFCRSAMPWAMDITGVRKVEERP
jgi:hypothetical protein